MSPDDEHALDWNDRLQDWLDGDLSASETGIFEAHLAQCARCQRQIEAFRALDDALQGAAPKLTLDETFDQRLFAQIDALDERQRAAARARVEQEHQENLQALSRSWRRTVAFIAPGVLAGIALAFALSGWLFSSELSQPLLDEAPMSAETLSTVVTALLGAAVGVVIARWLASYASD